MQLLLNQDSRLAFCIYWDAFTAVIIIFLHWKNYTIITFNDNSPKCRKSQLISKCPKVSPANSRTKVNSNQSISTSKYPCTPGLKIIHNFFPPMFLLLYRDLSDILSSFLIEHVRTISSSLLVISIFSFSGNYGLHSFQLPACFREFSNKMKIKTYWQLNAVQTIVTIGREISDHKQAAWNGSAVWSSYTPIEYAFWS